MKNGLGYYLWWSVAVAICDQSSKWLVVSQLSWGDTVAVFPGLSLTLVYNTGVAFSMLATMGDGLRWFLLILSLAICLFLLNWLRRLSPDEKITAFGIALIIGGAIGNMIDRAWQGYVVDFVDVYYKNHHWPTFNVADSAITIGALMLIAAIWRLPNEDTPG